MTLSPDESLLVLAADDGPGRRLACAVLLMAALDARAGHVDALAWLSSGYAGRLARAVDLKHWPPSPSQLARKSELRKRVSELDAFDVESLRGLSLSWQRYRRKRLERETAGGNGRRKGRPRPVRINTAGSAGSSANWGRG